MNQPADIHKAAAIIIQDHKLLVSRSKGKEYFVSPGGKLEPGESAEDALCRELAEEQGITLARDRLKLLGTFYAIVKGHEDEQQTLKMDVYMVESYEGELMPQAEIEENRWVDSRSAQDIELGSIFAHDVIPRLKEQGLID